MHQQRPAVAPSCSIKCSCYVYAVNHYVLRLTTDKKHYTPSHLFNLPQLSSSELSEQSSSTSHTQVFEMHRPLLQRNWFWRQVWTAMQKNGPNMYIVQINVIIQIILAKF